MLVEFGREMDGDGARLVSDRWRRDRTGWSSDKTTELLLFELSSLQLPQAGTTRRMLRAC